MTSAGCLFSIFSSRDTPSTNPTQNALRFHGHVQSSQLPRTPSQLFLLDHISDVGGKRGLDIWLAHSSDPDLSASRPILPTCRPNHLRFDQSLGKLRGGARVLTPHVRSRWQVGHKADVEGSLLALQFLCPTHTLSASIFLYICTSDVRYTYFITCIRIHGKIHAYTYVYI